MIYIKCVGGSDVINDCNLPCGETLVRHILYGKRFFRDALGVDITTWWALDTFGHNAQMPQILKSAGFKSMWFSRGAPHRDLPSEFRWQGLDGSQIDAYWLPFLYAHLYDPANVYAHEWQPNDLVIWDNLTVQHARPEPNAVPRTLRRFHVSETNLTEDYLRVGREHGFV